MTWFRSTVRLVLIFSLLLILLFSASVSCAGEKEDAGFYDTTNLKKVANFLSEKERKAIIEADNGLKTVKGFKAWPQDGDDFRNEIMDTIFWEDVSVRNADFRGVTMRSSDCSHSDFSGSDFRASDIRWTEFDYSFLQNCRFDQAKMFHVKVNFADLSGSSFQGTNMFGMEGEGTRFLKCDMRNALMKDVEFINADFTHTNGLKARLIRAVLKKSVLDSTNFAYADFTGAQLDGASFKGATLRHADLSGAQCYQTDFSGADLKDVNFFKTYLNETNFKGAKNIPPELKPLINEKGLATGMIQDLKYNKRKH